METDDCVLIDNVGQQIPLETCALGEDFHAVVRVERNAESGAMNRLPDSDIEFECDILSHLKSVAFSTVSVQGVNGAVFNFAT